MAMTGKEMGETLDNFANGASRKDIADFVEHVTNRAHRTLQQKIMGVFVACIESWGDEERGDRDDMRNEATIKLCRKILAATGDKYDRVLPYI